jgi:hypothetical protein
MSALGQKQTYALQQAMSALHPIATMIAYFHEGGPLRVCNYRQDLFKKKSLTATFERAVPGPSVTVPVSRLLAH